ncbi:conserved hypothetical protein [Solidesulfovibrio fructosivorans JJ]]|uniref:Uncharacterized protein n=1 Tax=Solidesulfovibrio fructosivorans JJ] TaxID=596151 RepID=E1JYG6_SOLFR|nr:hypothetical protein [Solidesulfovibrio fructosivorans]EFL50550.1 conserved hypothetical protein [Solidesulfovibrio fructosivorans JJ]]
MAEARKVFPMNAFVSYLKGVDKEGNKKAVADMVGYMAGMEIDAELAPFAAALAKAWIYEQHPELVRMSSGELSSSAQNVSVSVMPPDVVAEVNAIFAKLTETKKANEELAAKLEKVEAELAEKTAILKDVEVRCKAAEDKAGKLEASMKDEGEKVIVASEAKVTEYIGKVDELLKMIEDVKKHGVVTVAGGGAAAGGEASSGSGEPEVGGEPSSDFGFGSDAFATDKW